MPELLVEGQFGHGAAPSRIDVRDKQFIAGAAPFDWQKGYDVEEELGFPIPTKNQGQSGSCGGQAWSYYWQTILAIAKKAFTEKSAKFIYSQTYVPGGGSSGRDNCKIVQKQGVCSEANLSSYDGGNPPSEAFMERSGDIDATDRADASQDESTTYFNVNLDIESIAQAIQTNHGVIIGVAGQNNGTWLTSYPVPPTVIEWRHWLYAGKVRQVGTIKYIGVKNSWGDQVGDHGWQWLPESYFQNQNVFEAWAMTYNQQLPFLLQKMVELLRALIKLMGAKPVV